LLPVFSTGCHWQLAASVLNVNRGKHSMIYLDNASTSWPKPPRVVEEMARFLRQDAGSPGRAGHRMALAAERVVRDVRAKLSRLIHAESPERIALCLNGTDALNMAIKGVLREGDHVICTVSDHNSVSRPLQALAEAGVITLTRLPIGADECVDLDAVRAAIQPRTKLMCCIHASNVTGAIQPVVEISRIVREHGALFLVDAAQTIGVVDIDVAAMGIDLLTFPGHKALLGPTGTGALYSAPRVVIRPWREGGTGADSIAPTQPQEYPTWLEAGTPNTVGLAGLSAALDEVDPPKTLAHKRTMLRRLIQSIADNPRIQIVGGTSADNGAGVLSLNVEGTSPNDVAAILDSSFGIAVRAGLHCAPYAHRALGTFPDGTIRIAPGWATTSSEMDQLSAALREVAAG
jgi:cysteine desulfurase family protein